MTLNLDATTWFAAVPTEARFTHASIEKRSPTFNDELAGTCTQPAVPSRATAVSGSLTIAPGWPSVVPA